MSTVGNIDLTQQNDLLVAPDSDINPFSTHPLSLNNTCGPSTDQSLPSPPTTSQLLKQSFSGDPSSLKIAHLNAQSIISHFHDIETIFSSLGLSAILISESWLTPTIPSSFVHLDGYTLLRNDRAGKRGGGVCAYVLNELRPRIIYHSPPEYSARPEFLFVEIQASLKKCLLCVVYKPPKIGYICDLENALTDLIPCYDHTIVTGDFNINLLQTDSTLATELNNMFQSLNMTIAPLHPTHHTATTDTLLDLIVTTHPQKILTHGQLPAPGISAHDIIYVEYSLQCPKRNSKLLTYRDLQRIDETNLNSDALQLPWHTIWSLHSVDEKVETFNALVLQLYDKHAPIKTRRFTRPPAPWMNDEIHGPMAKKRLRLLQL